MKIKLALNATPLLAPLTGIGHYTANLLEQLRNFEELEVYPFYGTSWMRRPQRLTRLSLRVVRKLVRMLASDSTALTRSIQQQEFDRGLVKYGISLYHEPNFCPLEFGGHTVITVHDLAFIRFPETLPAERLRHMERCVPAAVAGATRILVNSEFTKSELTTVLGVAPDKIAVTHLGVGPDFHPRNRDETRSLLQRYGLSYRRYLLFVGTLEPRKNLVRTLRAYATLPASLREHHPLVLVGMKGWLADEITHALDNPSIRESVHVLQYVPDRELAVLFAGASMLVYPSLYEGFGMPLSEAMACGIPVITSDRASMPEIAGDAGIAVNPYDVDAIACAIRQILENPEEAARRGELGIARAKQFTWEECARRTLAVYRQCAGAA